MADTKFFDQFHPRNTFPNDNKVSHLISKTIDHGSHGQLEGSDQL